MDGAPPYTKGQFLASESQTITAYGGNVEVLAAKLLDGTTGGSTGLKVTSRQAALVEGPDPLGATPSAAPFRQAGVARTALPTVAAAGNLVEHLVDKYGRLVVARNLIPNVLQPVVTCPGGSQTDIMAASSGLTPFVVNILATNNTNVATLVNIRAGSGGAVLAVLYFTAFLSFQWRWDPDVPLMGVVSQPVTADVVTASSSITFTTMGWRL